jgi:hypothetical protein
MRKVRIWTRGKVVKKGKVLKKAKMLKKVNNKRRKKGILRVSKHLEVIDEGEENSEVMRQYQRELEADECALEEDSSDDDYDDEEEEEEDHVPLHW